METIKQFFKNDQFAAHTGIELVEVTPGRALARMPICSFHRNGLGTVQGGAIFTLADFTFAAASNAHGTVAVAVNVSISFMKAATAGVLTAEARELSRNSKLGTYTVEVKNDTGELIAIFQGLVYRKKETLAELAAQR
jgi:acyl-CoA thioesterase